jgi:hypothetical protein
MSNAPTCVCYSSQPPGTYYCRDILCDDISHLSEAQSYTNVLEWVYLSRPPLVHLFRPFSWVFPSSTVLFVWVALSAGFVPALSASRINPMCALRYE